MNPKLAVKITIDFLMMVSLLALMAYGLIGAVAHEWIGTIMFALMIIHNIMNRKWWRKSLKGRYTCIRTAQTIINVSIFIGMIVQMVSGIIISRFVFTFIPIAGGISYARTAHLVSAYWNLTLMSMHLGFHGSMLMGIVRKITHIKAPSLVRVIALRIVSLSIFSYGVYAFMQRELGSYMFLKSRFVFFDYSEPIFFFFIDYLAIMCMFVIIGHYLSLAIRKTSKRVTVNEEDKR